METTERRIGIMRTLCRRRHETISNLAREFGVSKRTIARDIEYLSRTEPIYTQVGRYEGGIYVMDDYSMDRMYMSEDELHVLHKLLALADSEKLCLLEKEERDILCAIIAQYTKPNHRKDLRK